MKFKYLYYVMFGIGLSIGFNSNSFACGKNENSYVKCFVFSDEKKEEQKSEYKKLYFKNSSWKLLDNENASLNFKDNEVSIYMGCNRISGSYKVIGNQILFNNIVSTKMYCDNLSKSEASLLNKGLMVENNTLISDSMVWIKK